MQSFYTFVVPVRVSLRGTAPREGTDHKLFLGVQVLVLAHMVPAQRLQTSGECGVARSRVT